MITTLNHPNILKVHECLIEDKGLLMVEDSHEGGCLADKLNHLNAEEVMKQVALGLHYLHNERKLIHTRLSLEHIFLREGVAVIGAISRLHTGFEETGMLNNCPYIPPELLETGSYSY